MKGPYYANADDYDSKFFIANSFPKPKINFHHARGLL